MSNFCQQGDITKIFIVDTGNTGSTGTDIYVTGGTYFGGTLTLGRNDGVTIPITGFSTTSIFTGNTSANCISNLYISNLHGCSPITIWDPIVSLSSISATTYYGDGSNLSGIPDYYVTGGTYSNGSLTLNRQNGIVTVTGFSTTDTYVTGFTYNDANRLTISQNGGQSPLTVTINNFTGLTVTGSISATTYLNLPPFITGFTDNFVTGGTFSSGTLTLNRQNGIVTVTGFTSTDTFVTGFTFTNDNTLTIGRNQGLPPLPITINNLFLTGLTVNGSISASTYLNLPAFITGFTDNFVTGGTFSSGTLTLNRQNGSVFITGFTTSSSSGGTDTFVTGFTFTNNNTLTIDRNQGLPPLPVIINNLTLTGLTVNGVISASTYLNLPAFITGFTDTYVTGFTYNDANRLTISQNGGQPPLNVFINTFTGITTHYLDVNTNVTETSAVGRLNWNNTDGTLDLGLKGGNVTLQIGQEQVVRVVNKTGANLLESQYKVVRIRRQSEGGSQGQRLAIVLAQANNDPNSVDTLGIVTENIDNNQEGFITSSGLVRNINTTGSLQSETWLDGDVLYLSPITAGELTKVKPIAPQHTVIMGYVVYAHVNNGKIFVKVDNGYELDELHNVRISGETNNQVLSYDSVQSVWVNRTLPAFITGFTDNFVTGGTYSSGTLTLNRQNGSVIITGFTTSSSSGGTGIDTYVTGFTYSNNNLTIIQNQGQSPLSVTINNFTGLTINGSLSASTYLGLPSFTFTGNTSASCISNIYVSNLHGCSPITIHDSIKSVGSSATGITSFAFGNTTVAAGDYSHAEGESTIAIGISSHAEGSITKAVGDYSHAEGDNTQAKGNYSHTEGQETIASGFYSHAEGYLTNAIGLYSHTEGNSTYTGQYFYTTIGVSSGVITLDRTYGDVSTEFTTTGIILENSGTFTWYELDSTNPPYFDGAKTIITLTDTSVISGTNVGVPGVFQPTAADILLGGGYSHAEGDSTIAIGTSSHAEGYFTTAIGFASHAEGESTTAIGANSHAEGGNTEAIGFASHAEGRITQSIGTGSHAEGISTQAIGDYSHSEGYYTIASGSTSHAEGESTTAIGANSHAEGYLTSTNVKGLYSHAEGHGSQAGDIGSHAEGYFTQANGNYSHSQGTNTIASGDYSFASGSGSTASGIASFIHSSRSVVLGDRSVVLGGQGISGTSNDFVYVSNLNINSIPVSNSGGTQVLVRNSSTGNIEYRDSSTLGGGTGIDTYVTGFTYSNNNLSINQNQGQSPLSVTINNFTGLTVNGSLSASTYLGLPSFTFTGNTSASCISDIYVSNLHGCSPITIHDSIKSVGSSATGITSFAFGNTTVAAGDYSHAEGELTQAIGGGSHAEGNGTITVGGWSHAEGYGTQANGGWSHAEGYVTQAIGDYSHAEGNSTYTGQYFYTTIGVSSGVITLDRTYGDVSAEFTATGIILEDAGPFTWYELDPSSSPYFDGTNTIIYLADTSVNSGTYIGVPGVFQPTAADILLGNFYSHAEGYGTIAIGNSSHAEGRGTSAIGDYSHAEGYGTQANGGWSHAEGYFTTAIGGWSHAEGESTTSSGAGSHAEGISTQAIGDYSHSEGYYTTAIGANSHAEGESTTAIGANSHAEGGNTEASGQYSHTEGVGTDASGTGSHAEGSGGKNYGSIGDYSHTEGRQTTTNGDYSHAEGYLTSTNVKGLYSHAEGHGSQAGDIGSHAEGYFTQANGNYSHSQGTNTIASGDYSFASGSASTASGIASFIHSSRSVVTGNRSVVLGGQGISGTSSDFVYVSNLNINSIPVSNSGGTQVLVRNSSTGNIEYNSNIQVQIDALKVEEVNLQDIGTGLPASTYTIVLNAKYARRINELTVIAGSGTCTLTMNINNTPVTGISGVSVTTTGTTYTTTATNVVAVGNTVTMVTISNSGLANLRATIKTTR